MNDHIIVYQSKYNVKIEIGTERMSVEDANRAARALNSMCPDMTHSVMKLDESLLSVQS